MISAALIGRVLAAADVEQRRTKRSAKVDIVAAAIGIRPTLAERALGVAFERGLVKPLVCSGGRPSSAFWVVLPAGREAVKAGYGRRSTAALRDNDLRTRAWRAMRLQRKFTAHSLLVLAFEAPADTWKSAYVRVCRYLLVLEGVGIVKCIHRSREGKRFLLIEDLGSLAPVPEPSKARVYDPNAKRFIERPTAAQLLGGGRT